MQAPDFTAVDHDSRSVKLSDAQGQWRILAFVSPGSSACESTIQTLNETMHERPDLTIMVIGGAAHATNYAYALERNAKMPILTPDATLAKEVYLVQGMPFVYILDEEGVIRAKGVVNEPAHLQNLLVSADGPASLPHYR